MQQDYRVGISDAGALFALAAALLADVISAQQGGGWSLAAQAAHIGAVLACVAAGWAREGLRPAVAALLVVALLTRALDHFELLRFAYLVCLFGLFAIAGAIAVRTSRRSLDIFVTVLTACCAVVALLQLAGSSEALLAWSRHGLLPDGSEIGRTALPTFRRPVGEVGDVGFLQTRPSALFASNQLFSGFVLFATAFVVSSSGRLGLLGRAALACAAVLSMAKVAIFGVVLLSLFALAHPRMRPAGLQLLAFVAIAGVAYRFAFPGVAELTLNVNVILRSAIVRVTDIAAALGTPIDWREVQNTSWLPFEVSLAIFDFLRGPSAPSPAPGAPLASGVLEPPLSPRAETKPLALLVEWQTGLAAAIGQPIRSVVVGMLALSVTLRFGRLAPTSDLLAGVVCIVALLCFLAIGNLVGSPFVWFWFGCAWGLAFGASFLTEETAASPPRA